MPDALRLQAVARHYGRRAVLQDVDLALADGEKMALTGPNGSGKTTLLRVAATVLRPTAGTVTVLGTDAAKGHAARHGLGYLPQDAPVYAELTPAEHLRWWSRLHGEGLDLDTVHAHLADAGLARHAHRPAGTLSRGQRQRLALATAFAPAPRLLLLDEPFTALDAAGQDWLRGRIQAHPGAILAAVHDPAHAALFDRTHALTGPVAPAPGGKA